MKWALLVVAAGCSSAPDHQVDARADAPVDTFSVYPVRNCVPCTKVHTTATDLVDVASDGTTLYVRSHDGNVSTVAADGSLTQIAMTTNRIASINGGVAYAVVGASSIEVHELVGVTDRVLGSVAGSISSAQSYDDAAILDGNAADVYLSGLDPSNALTLWRFSRASTNTAPIVNTTTGSGNGSFALGSSSVQFGDGNVVAVPTSTRTSATSTGGTAFADDMLFAVSDEIHTTHDHTIQLASILPAGISLFSQDIDGSIFTLIGTSDALFWGVLEIRPGSPNGRPHTRTRSNSTVRYQPERQRWCPMVG